MAINGSDCIVLWEYFCSAQTEKPSITFPSFHSFVFTCHIKWQLEKPLVRIWHAKQISLESFCFFPSDGILGFSHQRFLKAFVMWPGYDSLLPC